MNKSKSNSQGGGWFSLMVIFLCFILSGVAALIYQTAWTRQFSLVFGTSELATAAVLAAYMGGLALGAYLIEQQIKKINRPVRWYAALEIGIAVSAVVLIPAGLWFSEKLLVALFGNQPSPPASTLGGTSLFYLIAAFAVLLVPTTLMGATLPLLARHTVHSEQQIGRRIGLLYAFNTSGAVVGALLGALVLLPNFGLNRTVWIAASINALVALLALSLSNTSADQAEPQTNQSNNSQPNHSWTADASPLWVLPIMLCSGAVSFLHEVLWTRMLGHVMGSSLYAFGIMLASFLVGIALGGGLGAVMARSREIAARWLAISELAAALAAIFAWWRIQQISTAVDSLSQRGWFSFWSLFPLAFAIGLTYPLAVRVLARNVEDAALSSARVYSWNTVGAIIGAITGGFLIVPALRYEGSVHLAVIASCGLAIITALVFFRSYKALGIPLILSALTAGAVFLPKVPEALLRYSPLRVDGQGELLYYDVGRSAAVALLRQRDQIAVRTNGLPEANIDALGTFPQLYVEAWMAPLAVLARPQLQDMLIVGLGGARVLEAVPPSVHNIDVIELEEKVVEANQSIANKRLRNPLADPRINIILNDARGSLHLTNKRYDAVVSQPSHPWTAGASHLYTKEFMQQAKDHLNPGGLFVQWINVDFLDEQLLRSLVATINDVYPYVRVYRPAPPTLLFLASDQPIQPEKDIEATRAALAASPQHYQQLGINVVEDLIAALVLDNEGSRAFANNATVITDERNRFATASVYDFGKNISAQSAGYLLAPYDPLLKAESFFYKELNQKISYSYLGQRIGAYLYWDQSAHDRLNNFANLFKGSEIQPFLQAQLFRNMYQNEQADRILTAAQQAFPQSQLIRSAILQKYMMSLSNGTAPDDIKKLASTANEESAVVLKSAQLAAQGNWDGVAAMDNQLSHIPWTSTWIDQVAQLRVEWRARVLNPDFRSKYSEESLAIVNQISMIRSMPQLYLLRAWATNGLNNPALMESIARYSSVVIQNQNNMDEGLRSLYRNGINSLRKMIEALGQDPNIDKERYQEVLNLFNQASYLVG